MPKILVPLGIYSARYKEIADVLMKTYNRYNLKAAKGYDAAGFWYDNARVFTKNNFVLKQFDEDGKLLKESMQLSSYEEPVHPIDLMHNVNNNTFFDLADDAIRCSSAKGGELHLALFYCCCPFSAFGSRTLNDCTRNINARRALSLLEMAVAAIEDKLSKDAAKVVIETESKFFSAACCRTPMLEDIKPLDRAEHLKLETSAGELRAFRDFTGLLVSKFGATKINKTSKDAIEKFISKYGKATYDKFAADSEIDPFVLCTYDVIDADDEEKYEKCMDDAHACKKKSEC